MNKKIQIVFGPTASGKTEFAINLAKQIGACEIINADSMQIYKEIPIITNQPTNTEKQGVTHHLFGVKSILEHSDLAKWLELSVPLVKEILEEKKTPILVGGTGMYLKAIIEGVSPIPEITPAFKAKLKEQIEREGIEQIYRQLVELDPLSKSLNSGDTQRISRAFEVFKFTKKSIFEWNKEPNKKFFDEDVFEIHFLDKPREEIYERINLRFKQMVENGILDEAKEANQIFKKSSLQQYQLNNLPAYKAHGLREIISYLNGNISLEEAVEKSQQVTRNYAKRQFTWWRGWSKKAP